MEGKIAMVGLGGSVTVFKAAGVNTFTADDSESAKELIRKLAKDYKIIFITEELYKPLEGFLKRFDEQPYPVVTCMPSEGSDYGRELLKNAMDRALGVDILFND